MDRSEVIVLVGEAYTKNEYGVEVPTPTRTEVFCQVNDITRQEFFEAGRNGLNPSYMFSIFSGDYNGEDTVIYNDKAYGIYRTYHSKTDTLELYAERKGGVNGS